MTKYLLLLGTNIVFVYSLLFCHSLYGDTIYDTVYVGLINSERVDTAHVKIDPKYSFFLYSPVKNSKKFSSFGLSKYKAIYLSNAGSYQYTPAFFNYLLKSLSSQGITSIPINLYQKKQLPYIHQDFYNYLALNKSKEHYNVSIASIYTYYRNNSCLDFVVKYANEIINVLGGHQFKEMSYITVSAIKKTEHVRRIIEYYLKNNISTAIDFGGGFGLVGAGLALQFPSIKMVDIVDIKIEYKKIFNLMKKHYHLDDKLIFIESSIEDYKFTHKYDLIMFLGSLLFVDKSHVNEVLQYAWNALNPGGIIVIHENTVKNKADIPKNLKEGDVRKKVFIKKELDALVSKFATPQCYVHEKNSFLSVTDKHLTKYWILQKPAYPKL